MVLGDINNLNLIESVEVDLVIICDFTIKPSLPQYPISIFLSCQHSFCLFGGQSAKKKIYFQNIIPVYGAVILGKKTYPSMTNFPLPMSFSVYIAG